MLPPDYLINRIEPITEMYYDLHTAILTAIARHISDTLKATGELGLIPSAVYLTERLLRSGLVYDEIIASISETNKIGRRELRRLFEESVIASNTFDERVYRAAGLAPVPVMQSPEMLQILSAGLSKTLGSVERLTGTIAVNAQSEFERLLNLGYNKVASGAFSYREAIESTVDELVREGVRVFDYASGRHISVEAAVRMNVLTGVNQTAAQISKHNMTELGVSLVRTSAHLGARNKGVGFVNHESWQGKIFY